MFFNAANTASVAKDATDTFINVAHTSGTFDIFQSARDTFSSTLYQAGVLGAISRQAYKIYKGVSALSSSPSSAFNNFNQKNSSDLAKEWSSGAMKRLENFVRLGAAGYSCHLGSNVREYIKKVFDPPTPTPTPAQQQKPLTREEKIAKLAQQCRSRLAGLVVTPVIQSYLFTIEIMLAAVAHPIALYEIHKIQMDESGGNWNSNNNDNLNNNNNNLSPSLFSSSSPLLSPSAFEGVPLTSPESASASSSWFTKALNVAMKLSIGTPPPPQLLQPPPILELRGSLAAPSAEPAPSGLLSCNTNNNEYSKKNSKNDDDEDDENENEQQRKRDQRELNEMLLTLIRGMKHETEAYLDSVLGKEFFENLTNRVSTQKVEQALRKALLNPALYALAPPGLEWMIEVVLMDAQNNNNNRHRSSSSSTSSLLFPFQTQQNRNNNNNNNSNTNNEEPLLEIDQRVTQTYYRLLNQIVSTDSFNRLMLKGAEKIFDQVVMTTLDDAWPSCKSFLTASESVALPRTSSVVNSQNETNNNNNNNASSSSSSSPTPSFFSSSSSTIQVAHIGAGLTSVVYVTAETELSKALFPELFDVQEEKDKNDVSSNEGDDNNGQQPEVQTDADPEVQEEERRQQEETRMRERQLKMMRAYPSFGDLSTYGGLCMQFARYSIESNVGGEFFLQQE